MDQRRISHDFCNWRRVTCTGVINNVAIQPAAGNCYQDREAGMLRNQVDWLLPVTA
jgi:hypothetical protein